MKSKKPLSIYLHIPFCIRKCLYCDFLSAPASAKERELYVDALIREIKLEGTNFRDYLVQSIFIGGGTPSVLEGTKIIEIMQAVGDSFLLSDSCEISMEVNPGTITEDKMKQFRQAGINRLSIGLQSAVDSELAALGRIHSWQDFVNTYQIAVKTGFNNINIDLMSAIPHQTVASYQNSLHQVLSLSPLPTHISAYSLIVEEGTSFYTSTLDLPEEDSEREMYKITRDILEQYGFHRYEISNYAREHYECYHNKVYWQRGEYLGLGIGSASLVQENRYNRVQDIERYVNHYSQQDDLLPSEAILTDKHELTVKEQMEEFMFLGLRLSRGVAESQFYKLFHKRFEEVFPGIIEKNRKRGLLLTKQENAEGFLRVWLSDWGVDVSNQVMVDFLLT